MANAKLNAAIAAIDKKYYAILEAAKIELARLAAQYKIEQSVSHHQKVGGAKDAYKSIQQDCAYKHCRSWYNEIKQAHMQHTKLQFEKRVFNCFNAHPHTVSSTEFFPEFKTEGYKGWDEGGFTETILCAPYQGGFLTPSGEYFYFRTHSGDVYQKAYARIEIKTNIFYATPFFDLERNDACGATGDYIHQHPNAQ